MPNNEETARVQWRRFMRAKEAGHDDYIKRARLHESFYQNNQWSDADLRELDDQGRPALTINLVQPTVNVLLGEQASRRADVRFKPRRGGDQGLADVLTKVYGQISESNMYEWVEQQVFSDGLIMDGRGYFDVRVSYDDHVEGEVRITAKDPADIVLDPDAKEQDPATWTEIWETKWFTLDEIADTYGEGKKNQVEDAANGGMQTWAEADTAEDMWRWERRYGQPKNMPIMDDLMEGSSGEDNRVRAVRVIERQYRKRGRVMTFVDPVSGDERDAPNAWTDEQVEEHARENGYVAYPRRTMRVRWTVTAGPVVLHDDWSPYDDFTIVPFFPYFRRGRPFGVIRALLSPQEMLNKASSQMLHVINTTANSGWVIEEDSLANMDSDDLAAHGSRTGLVLEVKKGVARDPEKIQPNQVPPGLATVAANAAASLKEISGVTDAMRGSDSPEVSGVAIEAKQARGALALQMPLENLRRTRHFVARRVLALVQAFYTEDRIIYITNEDDPTKPREPMRVNEPTDEHKVANDLTVGEYDVVVSSAPARDSFDEMQFAEALSMRAAGIAIPDDAIVEYSHLSRKEELAKRMRMRTGEEMTPEQEEIAAAQAKLDQLAQELALAEQEAKVEKLEAETALTQAKAQGEQVQPLLGLEKERNKLRINREMSALRVRLAELSAETQRETAEMSAAGKLAATAIQAKRKKDSSDG